MSEPPSKRQKKDQPKPKVINLIDVDPGTFTHHASNVAFEGKVISTTAYAPNNSSFSFVLSPQLGAPGANLGLSAQRRIEVYGDAAKGASGVVAAGREVILLGRGGVCEELKQAKGKGKGKEKAGADGFLVKRWKVVYRQPKVGLHLWVRNTQTGENDHYSFGPPTKQTLEPAPSTPVFDSSGSAPSPAPPPSTLLAPAPPPAGLPRGPTQPRKPQRPSFSLDEDGDQAVAPNDANATASTSALTVADAPAVDPTGVDGSDDEVEAQLLGYNTSSGDQALDASFYEAAAAQADEAARAQQTAQASAASEAPTAPVRPPRAPAPDGEGVRGRKAQAKEDKKPWGLKKVRGDGKRVSYWAIGEIPSNFTANKQAVIAIVATVHSTPYKSTQGTQDWTTTLNLWDPTLGDSGDVHKANLFAIRPENLPTPNDGDVIIFTDINVQKRNGKQQFVGFKGFEWAVLRAPSLKLPDAELDVQLPDNKSWAAQFDKEEVAYARRLAAWWTRPPPAPKPNRAATAATVPSPAPLAPAQSIPAQLGAPRTSRGSGNRKLLTIADMREGVFCDTVAMVLSWQPNQFASAPSGDLYIADWTENDRLYCFEADAQRKKQNWPIGQRALQVTVYGQEMEPFASWGKDEVAGRMVYVRNLGPRRNPNGLLEGRVSDMGQRPGDRRLIRFLREGEYPTERKAIIDRLVESRKEQEEDAAAGAGVAESAAEVEQVGQAAVAEQQEPFAPAVGAVEPASVPVASPPLTLVEEKEDIKPTSTPPTPPPDEPHPTLHDVFIPPGPEAAAPTARPTQRVHNAFMDAPLVPVGFALSDAAEAERFRVRARIVDFAPPRMRDWVLAECGECGKVLPLDAFICPAHPHASSPPTLHFKFVLALQGAPDPSLLRLPRDAQDAMQLDPIGRPLVLVHVRGERARQLLPGLAPTWAMRRGEAGADEGEAGLNALRQRFGALLGGLVEAKSKEGGEEELAGKEGEECEFGLVKGRDRRGRVAWWFEGVELRSE